MKKSLITLIAFLVLMGSPLAVAVTDTNVVSIGCSITASITVNNPGSAIDVTSFDTAAYTTASYSFISNGGATITAVVQSKTGTHTGHTFTVNSTTTPAGTSANEKTLISNGTDQAAQTVVSAVPSGSYSGGVFTYGSTVATGGAVDAKTVTITYTLSA